MSDNETAIGKLILDRNGHLLAKAFINNEGTIVIIEFRQRGSLTRVKFNPNGTVETTYPEESKPKKQ